MLNAKATINTSDYAAILQIFEALAIAAGAEIIRIREAGITAEYKADDSPVTLADRNAEQIILSGLRATLPNIAVVAEEEAAAGRVPDIGNAPFILVDPLDGTKEFVNGNADFTVNIALIVDSVPVIGVVYAPARGDVYSGYPGFAFKANVVGSLQVSSHPMASKPLQEILCVVASRSHRTAQTDAFISQFENAETVSVGSSLKFCLLANGEADLYPRFGRTMEWDTAAGDAVLRAAGGVTVTQDGNALSYGKRNQVDDADFANPSFICATAAAKQLLYAFAL